MGTGTREITEKLQTEISEYDILIKEWWTIDRNYGADYDGNRGAVRELIDRADILGIRNTTKGIDLRMDLIKDDTIRKIFKKLY